MSLVFDADDLGARLDACDEITRHNLPFGVIRLDPHHRVTFFSRTEARLSGYGDRPVIGLDFFEQIAPCMGTPGFRGRLERERERGTLDIEIGHTGDIADPMRLLRCRVISAAGGGVWIAIDRTT